MLIHIYIDYSESSFAYNGRDFALIDDATAVQTAGNAIILWNTHTGDKDYIWSQRSGYCMVTSNYNNGLIAAAEYGLSPECHIYNFPQKQIVHRFAMDTTVKCISMAFSRDGCHLLMIGGVPDFRISIFDLQTGKKLAMPETKLPCRPEEFLQAKFDPSNRHKFLILTQTSLYCYTVHPAYVVGEEGQEKTLGESHRLEHKIFKPEEPDLALTRCIWDPYGRVHVCTDAKKFITVDTRTAKQEACIETQSRPCALLLTQKHLIVSLEHGLLQWIAVEQPPELVPGATEKDGDDRKLNIK